MIEDTRSKAKQLMGCVVHGIKIMEV